MLKSKNSQADYGAMSIPEQLLSKFIGHRMCHFLQNWCQIIGILTLKNGMKEQNHNIFDKVWK